MENRKVEIIPYRCSNLTFNRWAISVIIPTDYSYKDSFTISREERLKREQVRAKVNHLLHVIHDASFRVESDFPGKYKNVVEFLRELSTIIPLKEKIIYIRDGRYSLYYTGQMKSLNAYGALIKLCSDKDFVHLEPERRLNLRNSFTQ